MANPGERGTERAAWPTGSSRPDAEELSDAREEEPPIVGQANLTSHQVVATTPRPAGQAGPARVAGGGLEGEEVAGGDGGVAEVHPSAVGGALEVRPALEACQLPTSRKMFLT